MPRLRFQCVAACWGIEPETVALQRLIWRQVSFYTKSTTLRENHRWCCCILIWVHRTRRSRLRIRIQIPYRYLRAIPYHVRYQRTQDRNSKNNLKTGLFRVHNRVNDKTRPQTWFTWTTDFKSHIEGYCTSSSFTESDMKQSGTVLVHISLNLLTFTLPWVAMKGTQPTAKSKIGGLRETKLNPDSGIRRIWFRQKIDF